MATELDKLVDPAPAPGSPAAFILDNRRLPSHLQLSVVNRIDIALSELVGDQAGPRTAAIAKRAAADILELVATYIDGREISMISALNSAAYHVGKVQRSITERRK
jgi:hypothetical protein